MERIKNFFSENCCNDAYLRKGEKIDFIDPCSDDFSLLQNPVLIFLLKNFNLYSLLLETITFSFFSPQNAVQSLIVYAPGIYNGKTAVSKQRRLEKIILNFAQSFTSKIRYPTLFYLRSATYSDGICLLKYY